LPDGTEALTRAIAAGDTAAFARLYDAWFDRCVRDAHRMTGRDESFCLDVVQEAMLRVIRSLPALPCEGALAAWMRRAVRSAALDRLKEERRRAAREQARGSIPPAALDHLNEQIEALHAAVDGLEEADRSVLEMRHRFGWSFATIARVLGISMTSADRRLRRATGAVRARMEVTDD